MGFYEQKDGNCVVQKFAATGTGAENEPFVPAFTIHRADGTDPAADQIAALQEIASHTNPHRAREELVARIEPEMATNIWENYSGKQRYTIVSSDIIAQYHEIYVVAKFGSYARQGEPCPDAITKISFNSAGGSSYSTFAQINIAPAPGNYFVQSFRGCPSVDENQAMQSGVTLTVPHKIISLPPLRNPVGNLGVFISFLSEPTRGWISLDLYGVLKKEDVLSVQIEQQLKPSLHL